MEPHDTAERQRRGSCLSIMLTGGFVGFLVLLLAVATGGWAFHVLWIAAAIGLFGLIHYLLWGRMLQQQTAGEREEEEASRRADEGERDEVHPGANGVTRFH